MAQAFLGRENKVNVGSLVQLSLFALGVLGSDLFLFYFAFLQLQTGNETLCRNEVDEPGNLAKAVASLTWILALVALLPST